MNIQLNTLMDELNSTFQQTLQAAEQKDLALMQATMAQLNIKTADTLLKVMVYLEEKGNEGARLG